MIADDRRLNFFNWKFTHPPLRSRRGCGGGWVKIEVGDGDGDGFFQLRIDGWIMWWIDADEIRFNFLMQLANADDKS